MKRPASLESDLTLEEAEAEIGFVEPERSDDAGAAG